jgi:hypothetical protein
MPVIIACRENRWDADLEKPGFTRRGDEFASRRDGPARCGAMMPKRFVAAVLIGALVLAGGGLLGSFFF